MIKTTTEQHLEQPQRGRRLSPEIDEFLHMLNALEGQLADKTDQAPAIR